MNNMKKTTIALAVSLLTISSIAQANYFFVHPANAVQGVTGSSFEDFVSNPVNSSPSDPNDGDVNDNIYPITFPDVMVELSFLHAEYDSSIDFPNIENYNEIKQFIYNNDIEYSETKQTSILSNIIYEGDLSSFSSDFFAMPAYIYEPSEGIIQLGYLETEIIYEVFKNGTVSLSQNSSSYDYSNYTTELNIDVPFIIEDSRFDNLDTETTHSLYYTIRASYL